MDGKPAGASRPEDRWIPLAAAKSSTLSLDERREFFFGAASKFKDAVRRVERPPRVLILRQRHVLAVDATGLRALGEANVHANIRAALAHARERAGAASPA